jgi:dihydrolipoamide dehydrogenase
VLGSELIAPRGEDLAHLLAWASEQRMTVGDLLRRPFHHPAIEGALKAALTALSCCCALKAVRKGFLAIRALP